MNAPPSKRSIPDLPPRYYLDHFREVLGVIEDRYMPVLSESHRQFIESFKTLGDDAQCLYVRMLNRQGVVFEKTRFHYEEINRIPVQIDRLRQHGFVRELSEGDKALWLDAISHAKIVELLASQYPPDSFRRGDTKAELVQFAYQNLVFNHPALVVFSEQYVVQSRCEEISYLLFLYFGKCEHGLLRFTMRDLGLIKKGKFRTQFKPRFTDKRVALDNWFYADKLFSLKSIRSDSYECWANKITEWIVPEDEQAVLLRQKLIYQLGAEIEKKNELSLAIKVYGYTDSWPASERLVRLRYAQGEKEAIKDVLERMIDDPSCDEELLFARDFYERKYHKKRTSRMTDILREGAILKVDESYRNSPELGAAEYYVRQGATVFHSENRIWKRLFGLLFWQYLFLDESSGIFNDFERRPAGLDTGVFYRRFKKEIEKRLLLLTDTKAVVNQLLTTVTREYDKPNGVFYWHPDMLEELNLFIRNAPAKAMAVILRRMAKDYGGNHSGFPDLLVVQNNAVRFIEIKSEGDQLQRNQLKQIVVLEQAGFSVAVNRVEWVVDPDQEYVVVDIETTGRRSDGHAITEIAAVRVCHGEVVDEWQSLINPCRSIPRNITLLTGITNEMVADAPLFVDIADVFREFTEGAIFVAHNVNFDYGFIGDAYRYLGQRYQRPTLCSCAQMRKWYPGKGSYSLKNLCLEFEIDLVNHHRAMSDARAAAELLNLVNQKRMSDSG